MAVIFKGYGLSLELGPGNFRASSRAFLRWLQEWILKPATQRFFFGSEIVLDFVAAGGRPRVLAMLRLPPARFEPKKRVLGKET